MNAQDSPPECTLTLEGLANIDALDIKLGHLKGLLGILSNTELDINHLDRETSMFLAHQLSEECWQLLQNYLISGEADS